MLLLANSAHTLYVHTILIYTVCSTDLLPSGGRCWVTVGCGVAESRGGREGGTSEHCLPQLHLQYVGLWSEYLQHIHTQYSHMCNMYIQAHIHMYCILIRAYYIQGWMAPKIRINHMSNVHDSVKQPAKHGGGQLSLHVYLTYVLFLCTYYE